MIGVRILAGVLLRLEVVPARPDRTVVDDVLEVVRVTESPRDNGLGASLDDHHVDRVHETTGVGIVVGLLGLMRRVADPADFDVRKRVEAGRSADPEVVRDFGHQSSPPPGG